jgi:hypothetical protein
MNQHKIEAIETTGALSAFTQWSPYATTRDQPAASSHLSSLELTITLTDPRLYTRPFVLATNRFKRIPDQRFDEQLCIPSQVLDYLRFVADPAQ